MLSHPVSSTTQIMPWRANNKKNMFSFHSSLKSLLSPMLLNMIPFIRKKNSKKKYVSFSHVKTKMNP